MTLTCDTCGRALLVFRVFPGEADGEGAVDIIKIVECSGGGGVHRIEFSLVKIIAFAPERGAETPPVLN